MPADAAEVTERWPNYQEGDFVITDYVFRTGETLPELKLHYRTLGTARRNTAGKIINGVLLLQGNTGTGANWLRSSLADELFAPGEPLDAAEYFIIMPDAIGRGGSSKPSDGLKGKFPHYRYHDMVESGYRLITDCLDVGHLRLIIGSSFEGWRRRHILPAVHFPELCTHRRWGSSVSSFRCSGKSCRTPANQTGVMETSRGPELTGSKRTSSSPEY